jgi:nitrogen fixation NifU-like protein
MTADLYQKPILAHAKEAVGAGELEDRDGRAVADNPFCGDRITMDVRVAGDVIESVAYSVRGCVLCQATASIIGARASHCSRSEIADARAALTTMLDGTGEPPSGKWQDLGIFAPVAAHGNRHYCVLLPFEALHRALDAARATK